EGLAGDARTDGPGRVCKALGIGKEHNRLELYSPGLHLLPGPPLPEARVARGPRIGVDYAGAWAAEPFRFWDRDSQHVSRPPSGRARKQP
ncbi:3-methyladenine DNA glycosylase, partial [Pyxidicoccus fallax]